MTYLLCHPAPSPRDSPTQGTINSRPTGHEDTRRTGRHEIRALWLRADPPVGPAASPLPRVERTVPPAPSRAAAAKRGTSRTRPARSGAGGEGRQGRSGRLAPLARLPDGLWRTFERAHRSRNVVVRGQAARAPSPGHEGLWPSSSALLGDPPGVQMAPRRPLRTRPGGATIQTRLRGWTRPGPSIDFHRVHLSLR